MSSQVPAKELICVFCGASVPNTSKYRGRFKRRHPKVCVIFDTVRVEKAVFNQQLSQGVRSVEEEGEENERKYS
jgi:hypothetical protein